MDKLDDLWVPKHVYLPDPVEWLHDMKCVHTTGVFKDKMALVIDVTALDTTLSSDPTTARAQHSSKTGGPANNALFVSTPRGIVVQVPPVEGGAVADVSIWSNSNCIERLEERYGKTGKLKIGGVVYELEMWGDKAFPYGRAPQNWKKRITKTGEGTVNESKLDEDDTAPVPAGKGSSLEGVVFDPTVAAPRTSIERVNRRVKKFKITSSVHWTLSQDRLTKILRVLAGINNFILRRHPDWHV